MKITPTPTTLLALVFVFIEEYMTGNNWKQYDTKKSYKKVQSNRWLALLPAVALGLFWLADICWILVLRQA